MACDLVILCSNKNITKNCKIAGLTLDHGQRATLAMLEVVAKIIDDSIAHQYENHA